MKKLPTFLLAALPSLGILGCNGAVGISLSEFDRLLGQWNCVIVAEEDNVGVPLPGGVFHFDANGGYTIVAADGKKEEEGEFAYANGVLTFKPTGKSDWTGTVTWEGRSKFTFEPMKDKLDLQAHLLFQRISNE